MKPTRALLAGAFCAMHALLAQAAPAMADAPHLVIDSPANGAKQEGAAIVKFHTENLTIDPTFGDEAKKRMPLIGHLHVTIDDNKWIWVYTSKEPIIIAGLTPGPHKIKLELADPNHAVLESHTVDFTMAN